jgi:hypothetical protein
MSTDTSHDDRLREECGVFGIFGHPDAAALTALGLHAFNIVARKRRVLSALMVKTFSLNAGWGWSANISPKPACSIN